MKWGVFLEEDRFHQAWVNKASSLLHLAHRSKEDIWAAVLGYISVCPSIKRSRDDLGVVVHAKHQDTQRGPFDTQALDQSQSTEAGHAHIEQQQINRMPT